MINDYVMYVLDCECDGLDPVNNSIIEISFIRMTDKVQKTWLIKSSNYETIQSSALRVNGHKLEDITYKTQYGKDNYLEPSKAIIEIENWIAEDNSNTEKRVTIAQNASFDRSFMEHLWKKCNSFESYPFGRRSIDTMSLEFVYDLASGGEMAKGYSLSNLIKKYGVKNDKAHTAASDTAATAEVFLKQIELLRNALKK